MDRLFESRPIGEEIYESSSEIFQNPVQISDEEYDKIFKKFQLHKKRGRQCLWKICNWKVDQIKP